MLQLLLLVVPAATAVVVVELAAFAEESVVAAAAEAVWHWEATDFEVAGCQAAFESERSDHLVSDLEQSEIDENFKNYALSKQEWVCIPEAAATGLVQY